ncbi:MAG: class I SAM-dependent methyltransferase [Chloroflexota bacterium]
MDQYDAIARFYDCQHDAFHDDVDFYRNLVTVGPILEVGCGTGRITRPLAEEGLEIFGVDLSSGMLRIAEERLEGFPNAHLARRTIDAFPPEPRFAAVLYPLNVLWHEISLSAQLNSLDAARQRILPQGLLVIAVSNPLTLMDRRSDGEVRQRFAGPFEGERLIITAASWDDEASQLLTSDLSYDLVAANGNVTRTGTRIEFRYTYRAELELLLQVAGFQTTQVYGSYDLDPYDAASGELIVVGRPREPKV